jgi:hypothetical protein
MPGHLTKRLRGTWGAHKRDCPHVSDSAPVGASVQADPAMAMRANWGVEKRRTIWGEGGEGSCTSSARPSKYFGDLKNESCILVNSNRDSYCEYPQGLFPEGVYNFHSKSVLAHISAVHGHFNQLKISIIFMFIFGTITALKSMMAPPMKGHLNIRSVPSSSAVG